MDSLLRRILPRFAAWEGYGKGEGHVEALQAARAKLIERRRELASAIHTAAQRDSINGSIAGLIQVQAAIGTIDQAIADETAVAKAEKKAKKAATPQIRLEGMKVLQST